MLVDQSLKFLGDNLLEVFDFLSTEDIVKCSRVCSLWHSVIEQHKVLCRTQNDILDDFGKVAQSNLLSWNELPSYAPLSHLFTRVMEKDDREYRIKSNNPKLETNSAVYCMPKAFTRNGNYQFAICNITDIEMFRLGDTEPVILKGEDDKMLGCLEVDGNYLFALRSDGIIVQWDYKKQEEKLRIKTAYAKKDSRLADIKGIFYCENGFYVKNSSIFLRYRNTDLIEVIPFATPEEAQLIESKKLIPDDREKRMIVSKDTIFELETYEVTALNLLTKEKSSIFRTTTLARVHDCAIYKNTLYVFDTECQLMALDIHSKEKKKFNFSYYRSDLKYMESIEVIKNLFFGLLNGKIHIFDLTSESRVDVIPFNLSFFDLGFENIEELFISIKKHLVY